jgi:hypothetical protein
MADIEVKPSKPGFLASSAFVTLGVSVRSNKEQILNAYDDRLFEGVPEQELDGARSRLTLPRDRLGEELRFLADVAPARAREALAALGEDAETATAVSEALPNLSRINACADLLSRFGSRALAGADQAQRDFDPASAREAIDQSRAASGFPLINDAAWSKDITRFQDGHASFYFDGLCRSGDPPATLARILEQRPPDASDWYSPFISKVVDLYDRWSEPQLVDIEESLDRSITMVKENASDGAAIEAIEHQLARWDAVNQPVQLRDQSKGLDEPKSKRIFNKVRNLAIWLANDCGEYASAFALSAALERTFPELPSVVAQLSEDLATLGTLVERSRSQELVQPLADVAERAKAQLDLIAGEIRAGKFAHNGRGIAGELYREHFAAVEIASQLTPPDLPWQWTRSVALDLNNEAAQPHAAGIVLEAILAEAPPAIAARIRDDLATLNGLKLQKEFHEALQRQDFKTARALASRIMDEVPDERDEYGKLAVVLDQRLSQRRRQLWFWGILAGIIGIIALADSGEKRPTGSGAPYDSTLYNRSSDAAGTSTTRETEDTAGDDDSAVETPPPMGNFAPLTITQLRYCKFEERRLELLESRVPPSAYGQFNTSVDDWNARCHNSQFRHTDGLAIDAELLRSDAQIQAEVAQTLREWTPAPAFTPAPSPAPSDSGDSDEDLRTPSWQSAPIDSGDPAADDENGGE